MTTLLRLTNITKRFGGVHALKGVSFDLRPGEVHAIVGENGAGKSTLIKTISGAHRADEGTIEIGGEIVEKNSPTLSRQLGVAVIYQQPAMFPDLTVAENIALRLERGGPWRMLNWRKRRQQAKELLAQVGADLSPDDHVRDLTIAQQQLVEIAGALGSGAKIIVLDEPTASLSDREVDNLFRVVRQLRSAGAGLVYISHRLEELPLIADRVTVLRDGAYIGTEPMAGVDRAKLIRMMVGRDVSAVFPKIDVPLGEVVLRVEALSTGNLRGQRGSASGLTSTAQSQPTDISFEIRAGEILGFAGLIGAGRTELARILFGLTPATHGRIFLRGKSVAIDSPTAAVAAGIAYVPEDRRRHGVILDMSVAANTTLAVLRRLSAGGMIRFGQEQTLSKSFVTRLGIKTPSVHSPVGHLSGGNQQKVAVARWLAAEPSVLILDEPTQGVDVGAKAEIHKLMGELASRGLAILTISSELPEVLGMSDRIAVMHAGQITGILSRAEATQERVLELALGHQSVERRPA